MKKILSISLLSIVIITRLSFADTDHGAHNHHSGPHGEKSHDMEDQTTITDEIASSAGIVTSEVTNHLIRNSLKIRGKILPSEHKIAHIIPRFSGIVRLGRKHIGDSVAKGEVLAIIESNQSLQPFEVKSQIAGTVINGHLIVGEFVPENQWIYIVADLSEVWADFYISLRDRSKISIGKKIIISEKFEGTVSYIAPYVDEKSQSQLIRVVIPNPDGEFLPGMFITADLLLEEFNAKTAIKNEAIQTYKNHKVVFVKDQESYQARKIILGSGDEKWSEVLEGLKLGEKYVSENSYLIKADILKSEAEHEH